MRKRYSLLAFLFCQMVFAQVGINTTNPDAQLDVRSSNQASPSNTDGMLIPKIDVFPVVNPTAAQNSMLVYLTTVSGLNQPGYYYWDNPTLTWISFGNNNNNWKTTGNSGTNATTNFIGTTDNVDVVFKRNNTKAGLISVSNTSFGNSSLLANTTGFNNSAFGGLSMSSNTTGISNSAFGSGSLLTNTTGQQNSAFGGTTLTLNTTGSFNSAFGSSSLSSNTTGSSNSAFGVNSLDSNTTGFFNSAYGVSSLSSNTTGSSNSAFGVNSLRLNTIGVSNSAFGLSSLFSNTTGSSNSAFGVNSLNSNTTGFFNSAYGLSSLSSNTTGNSNSAFGVSSLFSNTTGVQNSAFGFSSLSSNTNGFNNSAFGFSSLSSNISGVQNSSFGNFSLNSNTNGNSNSAFGINSLLLNTIGTLNSAFGLNSLVGNTTGNNNTAFGISTLNSNTTGSENTALGSNADVGVSNLTNATAIGAFAQVGSSNSLVLGSINGVNGAISSVNVGVGTTTPLDKLHIVGNIRMVDGNQAVGRVLTSDANGTATWQNASNNAWGLTGNAGTSAATNFIGTTDNVDLVIKRFNTRAGFIGTTNTSLGLNALNPTNTGTNNTAIGSGSLDVNTTGIDNMAAGFNTLTSNTTGSHNTTIGVAAMVTNSSGNFNTAIGRSALFDNTTGSNNTATGYNALGNTTTGINNTAVGYNALVAINQGNNNTAIGVDSTTTSTLFDNTTAIGYKATVGASNCLVLGSINGINGATSSVNVGIGTTSPQTALEVVDASVITSATVEGTINVLSNGVQTIDSGGSITLGGNITDAGTTARTFGSIEGRKATGTTNVSSGYLLFKTNNAGTLSERMRITNAGDVGIGTTAPGGQFELSLNEGRKPTSNTWTIPSDMRLKTVNGLYEKGLTEILKLKPIRYNYKNTDKKTFEQQVLDKEAFGFLAQEVQPIFPEAVGTDVDGYLNFDLHPILIASINAFKELNTKNEKLEKENQELKQSLQTLNQKIELIAAEIERLKK